MTTGTYARNMIDTGRVFVGCPSSGVVTSEICRQDETGNFRMTKTDSIDGDKTYLLQLNSLSECFR